MKQSLKDKILLKKWRRQLTPKQVALFKLVTWCCLLVWMVFFMTHSIITAKILAQWAPLVVGEGAWQQAVARMIPFWYVFTVALIIVIVARWAYRKLRGRPEPPQLNQKHKRGEDK